MEQAIKTCKYCGKDYKLNKQYSKAQIARSKFCSQICQSKGRDKSYTKTPWNKGKKRAIPRQCTECSKISGKVAFYKKWQKLLCPNHYHHYRYYGKALWGDNRPYKTPKIRREKYVKAIGVKWRKDVFERDNYTCQHCGQKGGILQADHIKPFAYFPKLRWKLSNGRTLCVPCHKKTDTYGNKYKKIYEATIKNKRKS